MWSAKADWNTKSLRRSNCNVCAQFARRSKKGEGKQICSHDYESTSFLDVPDKGTVIRNISLCIWVLNDGAEVSFIDI